MRTIILLCLLVLCSSLTLGQIPNAGFETWADDGSGNNNPVGWETTNSNPSVSVDPFTPAHQGSFAMRVKTVSQGMFTLPGAAILQTGVSFSEAPAKFGAWVRSTIMAGDTALIIIGLLKSDTVVAATDSCTFKIGSSYAVYTYLEFPIRYLSGKVPDSLYIMVATGLIGSATVGTEIIVDDIAFVSGLTEVAQQENRSDGFQLAQNYPNPFNPETAISFQLPAYAGTAVSNVKLTVLDMLGRRVAVLVDEVLPAGKHRATWNAAGFPSGVYLVHMSAGSFSATRKVVLMR